MSNEKSKLTQSRGAAEPAGQGTGRSGVEGPGVSGPVAVPPFFRPIDWLTMAITTAAVLLGYCLTLAPDLTLQDAGELAVGSYYAGVPHPPGYPVWTILTWLFTVLLPFSNICWRVAVSSAVFGALSAGLVALMVSRGGSMIMEGIEALQRIPRRQENGICLVSGFVGGNLLAFNGFFWSQCVIVEVYPLSVLSLMGVLVCLMRWLYAPHQKRYLYWGAFLFGICFTNHQTLIVAAMGIEVLILAVEPRYGRDLFCVNALVYVLGLWAKKKGWMTSFDTNAMLFAIFNVIGVASAVIAVVTTVATRKTLEGWRAVLRDLLLCGAGVYVVALFMMAATLIPRLEAKSNYYALMHGAGIACIAGAVWLARKTQRPVSARVRQGQSVAIGLSALYLVLLLLTASGIEREAAGQWLNRGNGGFVVAHLLGFASLAALIGFGVRTTGLASEIKLPAIIGGMWLLGSGFYFFMPVASMTNPPMNWGYPRTVDGFVHALTRGQYERTNPTNDPVRFFEQLRMYFEGAKEEFNLVYLLIALVPLVYYFFRRMERIEKAGLLWVSGIYVGVVLISMLVKGYGLGSLSLTTYIGVACGYVLVLLLAIPFFYFCHPPHREKAWLAGLVSIYLFLAVLLLILLNPNTDKQSRDLTKVFFTASYVMIAMWVGYGLAMIGGYLVAAYERYRSFGLYGAAVAAGLALYSLADTMAQVSNPLKLYTAVFGLALALAAVAMLFVSRQKVHWKGMLALFALMPIYTVLSHWWDNDQRGHMFGFWFGHDMFTPTIAGADGKPLYPEMARDAILFGGTDPGRFCPTYMIFCESFIPPSKRADPAFDRRDVYIITQNALADGTYLNYIRAHYNRSTQIDPPFFQELLRSKRDFERNTTNFLARAMVPVDRFFLDLGSRVEARRRAEGVYPPKEIHTPNLEESRICFESYVEDARKRLESGQLEPGEDVRMVGDRVQVSGQVSVMQINGLLTKVIFDRNPGNEFYVEESFPLKWMYPHLTPFGIIMKINREPLLEITEEMVRTDHEYWSRYADRLCGNWITYDTPVREICDFVHRIYQRGDFRDYRGSEMFARDSDAQKAFSKLRSAIGGVYAWRVNNARTAEEQQRMFKEADFAFRQAFAFCPFSPEAVFRYVNLLASVSRWEDALMVARTCVEFDPENKGVRDLLEQLDRFAQGQAMPAPTANQMVELARQYQSNPANFQAGFGLVNTYLQQQQTNAAMAVLDQMIPLLEKQWQSNRADASLGMQLANAYAQRRRSGDAEVVLDAIIGQVESQVQAQPSNAALAMQLVSVYLQRGKNTEAIGVLDRITQQPDVDSNVLLQSAMTYAQLQQVARLETTLQRLVEKMPISPEAWYDLAAVQAVQGKTNDAAQSLSRSIQLSNQRLAVQPGAKDLRAVAGQDGRFRTIHDRTEIRKLLQL